MRKRDYFSESSDAMLALEGMIDLAGSIGVLYAMSIILRRKGAVIRAAQVEGCASQLGIIADNDNVVAFSVHAVK